MAKSKYPLESLRQVRQNGVDDATARLASAVRERERAEAKTAAAALAGHAHEQATTEKKASEQRALEDGSLTAADLARRDAWEFQVRADAAKLEGEIACARASEEKAKQGEALAQKDLGAKKAEADVVDKDRARFTEKQTKLALATEEEAAEEAWRPRRA